MPRLSHFKIDGVVYLNEEFFSTVAAFASSCQIQGLCITWYFMSANGHNVTSIRGNFARWICTMPRLSHFKVNGVMYLDEDFFSTAAALASSCQIQDLDMDWYSLSADGHNVTSIGGNFARWICTMPRLLHFKIEGVVYLNEEFLSTAAALASSCQIQDLDITWYPPSPDHHNLSSIGGNFARWICTMPRLSHFKVKVVDVYLNEEFFSTAAALASSCQIQDLDMDWYSLSADGHNVTSIGGNFARWICTMPRLSHFKVKGVDVYLNEEFFSTAAALASSCQIQSLKMSSVRLYTDLHYPPSSGRNFAQWVCTMPRLSLFSVYNVYLPDEFFSTAATSASLCQIEALELTEFSSPTPVIGHQQSPTAFTCLALWVYTMPRLSQFELNPSKFMCEEFSATAAIFAANFKIQSLTLLKSQINDDLPHSNMIVDLARWVCNMPCLSHFRVCSSLLTTRFLSAATKMAQSCQLEDLTLSTEQFHSDVFCRGSDMARWVCSLPRLSRFSVNGRFLTHEFLSAATEMAESFQLEDLTLSMEQFHSDVFCRGSDMARWVCSLPRLSRFNVSDEFLTREFLSAATEMAESFQIKDLMLSLGNSDDNNPYHSSTGSDMARWVCSIPRLSRFSMSGKFLTLEFLSAAIEMAESFQIRDLTLTYIWITDELYEFAYYVTEDLARWVCTMPRLSRFSVKVDFTDMEEEANFHLQIREFVLDFGSSSFLELAEANLAQFLHGMFNRLLRDNLTWPESLVRKLASLATSCSVNLKSITINGKPRNEFLTDSQQSATRSHSDSVSPECKRRRETGHGSGQESSTAVCEPERSMDEPLVLEMVSRDDQERIYPSLRPKEPSIPSGSTQQAAQDQSEPSIWELMSMMTDLKDTITTKMDTVLSEVVSLKRDLAEVKKNTAEMEHSVADTSDRIAEVEDSKLPNLRKEIDKVRYDMEAKMLLYEIHNRKLNLLIYGVTPQRNENVHEAVYTVLANLLGVSRDQVEKIPLTNAHRVPRVGNPRENQSDRANNPPDPIIVRFSRMVDRDRVLRAFERPVQREDPPRAAAPRAAAPV
ncbi:uncharacterized protein [Diadema setosum]|uniref:uncharacterized protein n=1 Tax=Diadema setosum TaxID=31175 RepID=UPI003B3B13DA